MRVRWVGVSKIVGPVMCWKLVDDNSGEIICRLIIRSTKVDNTDDNIMTYLLFIADFGSSIMS